MYSHIHRDACAHIFTTHLYYWWLARGNVVHADVHKILYTHQVKLDEKKQQQEKRNSRKEKKVAKHLLYIWQLDTSTQNTHGRTHARTVERRKRNETCRLIYIWLEISLFWNLFSVTENCFTLKKLYFPHIWGRERERDWAIEIRIQYIWCINILRYMIGVACVCVLFCFVFYIHFSFALCYVQTINDANTATVAAATTITITAANITLSRACSIAKIYRTNVL